MILFCQRGVIHPANGIAPGVRPAAGHNAAVQYGQVRVRHDELGIDAQKRTQTAAGRTCSIGSVEGEQPRRQLLNGNAAVLAGIVLRKAQLPVLSDEVDPYDPPGKGKRRLDGIRDPALRLRLYHDTIDHDLNVVLFVFFKGDRLGQVVHIPVGAHAHEAGAASVLEYLYMLPLLAADNGRQHLKPCSLFQRHDLIHDLVDGLTLYLPAAFRAVRHADPRPQQPQIVMDLRNRADGGAGVARGRFLVDGDRRRKAVDVVHIRLVHLAEKLPGIARQALDIAPLPLRVNGIERKA